ncbi:hypothetical protein Poli38472_009852 [Pythium oligandrum]|uniref:Uncharacterized protein n=1 Tax=Pythium oligandrum TaxID=41045 RepID=A0A8K1CG11_PYTOL|nr:hypothetical protein Poli38472_009852 [Pythium oligandrum]|eukprot:TMW62359.1 hypothetical protein Poli38472_009852 [Pythium oligandrum]
MTTLEEAKAFLKKEGPDGTNLYDHLSDVLLKILVERPENLNDSFEYLSTIVKQQRFVPPALADNNTSSAKQQSKTHQENWTTAALDLLKIKSEDEAGVAAERPPGVADLLDEAHMFEWAGVGFSQSETFRLSVALQRLAQAQGTTSLRFWGKLLGLGADYYIAEGELAAPPEPEDVIGEEGVAGVNKFTYWAMKDDGKYVWVQLPNVKRAQILAARQLRRYIRGDLEGKVTGHPPFPGTEQHFLRAQIARISAGTVLAPAGYFQTNDNNEIEPVEEVEAKSAEQLADLGSWVHFSKEINARYGRMTPMPPQTNADGDLIPWEGEDFASPLRALSEDAAGSWRVDRYPATLIPAVGEFAVVRSLIWPGAVSIAVGKKFLNVYVGHGVKFSAEPYQRPLPETLQVGYGIAFSEDAGEEGADAKALLRFEGLSEQKDVLEDPTPPEEEE